MNKFSELNIPDTKQGFTGTKVSVLDIVNEEIIVHEYKIEPSKLEGKGNGKCLYLQISRNNVKHVVFSGSGVLMEQIEQVPKDKFPISTTIKKKERILYFS